MPSHFIPQKQEVTGSLSSNFHLPHYKFNGCFVNFRLTLLWYHAVIRPFVALDEGRNEEGMQCA